MFLKNPKLLLKSSSFRLITWYTIFFILTVGFVLWAAFTYLTAAGNEEKVKTAKNRLIYAAVSVVVALIALGFASIVQNFIQTGGR